jgi:adenylate cyclase
MHPRLERTLRMFTVILVCGMAGGAIYVAARIGTSPADILMGVAYGLLISAAIGGFELFAAAGPLHGWLASLSFTASLLVRSLIYAAVILVIQYFELGSRLVGRTPDAERGDFVSAIIFCAAFSVLMNLVLAVINIIGPRSFLNLATGRYHSPIAEDRFVLFVDIAGSTGLAEKLGGLTIHRFLDQTFRTLTDVVVDYRGEILHYVGDEVIVTWPARSGAIDCRPLRCFIAMRAELAGKAARFEKDYGAAPNIRGSLHFGTVIAGEIGSVKRAIVFNGDVMNTAARLEALSREVKGGFLVSRAAMERFSAPPPVAMKDLGPRAIRGRADTIDVLGFAT